MRIILWYARNVSLTGIWTVLLLAKNVKKDVVFVLMVMIALNVLMDTISQLIMFALNVLMGAQCVMILPTVLNVCPIMSLLLSMDLQL